MWSIKCWAIFIRFKIPPEELKGEGRAQTWCMTGYRDEVIDYIKRGYD